MKKITRVLLFSICIAVLLATLLTLAVSVGGSQYSDVSVFAICTIAAFGINWLAFIPANMAKTEHYYDLTGSLTYLTIVVIALSLSQEPDLRATIVSAMVVVWALRLGSFLFNRIQRDGKDDRFDDIKPNALRFFLAWTIQALWVVFTAACALAIITTTNRLPLGAIGLAGIVIWAFGFIIEIIADRQKSAFKKNEANKGRFISSGLWSWSRHPNYFGEIVLWSGIAVLAWPVLLGWQWLAMISPIFVYLLITRISGVNKLEAKAEEKWGQDSDYRVYKERTSSLILMPPK